LTNILYFIRQILHLIDHTSNLRIVFFESFTTFHIKSRLNDKTKLTLWSRETYMFTNSKLAKSIRLAMAVGVASTALIASNAVFAEETPSAED